MSSSFFLPGRIPGYMRRIERQYARSKPLFREIIASSRILVIEGTDYDSIDGGQTGHDVRLYVPLEVLAQLDINEQPKFADVIRDTLRILAQGAEHEYICEVRIEVEDDDDPDCQKAIPFSAKPVIDPSRLSIWRHDFVRVFISHRDAHKVAARQLANALEGYGLSCFVAHETIPANEEWRKVIVSGLETMEVMLAFITDDFAESPWTMQEIGYALGKGVPCISLKLQQKDPPGFISHNQALRGHLENPPSSAADLYNLLVNAVGRKERTQRAIISAFATSGSFNDTISRFDFMVKVVDQITEEELAEIITSYDTNSQIRNCGYLHYSNRLLKFLTQVTGRRFEMIAGTIRLV